MRLGSLCTGYGGLDLGAELALGPLEHVWHAEIDPDASKVLAAHWPDVTNLGDLTAVDWARVEPVDILTAGFPCQPVSTAGRRRGIEDERWLWDDIAAAIGRMVARPRLLVLENVPGLLTANRGHAMARVIHGLAALGYVGRYRVVSAASVGAAHRRERVFIVAWPAANPPRVGNRRAAPAGEQFRVAVAGSGRAGELTLLPTPIAVCYGNNQSPSPSIAVRPSLDSLARMDRWGQYAAAIARWEQVIGRPAPDPTEPGHDERPRLSSRFVEWLMGLPVGWVTDHLPRNPALRVLGNGVVPQQAAAAIRELVMA